MVTLIGDMWQHKLRQVRDEQVYSFWTSNWLIDTIPVLSLVELTSILLNSGHVMSPLQKIRLNQELVYPGAGALPVSPASPEMMVRCSAGIGGVGAGYNNLVPIPTLSVPPVLYLTPPGTSNATSGGWTIPTITSAPSRDATLEDIQQIQ